MKTKTYDNIIDLWSFADKEPAFIEIEAIEKLLSKMGGHVDCMTKDSIQAYVDYLRESVKGGE